MGHIILPMGMFGLNRLVAADIRHAACHMQFTINNFEKYFIKKLFSDSPKNSIRPISTTEPRSFIEMYTEI